MKVIRNMPPYNPIHVILETEEEAKLLKEIAGWNVSISKLLKDRAGMDESKIGMFLSNLYMILQKEVNNG